MYIGATALYFSDTMGYKNTVTKIDNIITQIKVCGIGGRIISEVTNKYEQEYSQPLKFNYPMLFSAEYNLPIRVFYRVDDKIIYLGLWSIQSATYSSDSKLLSNMYWIFTLVKSQPTE